MFNYKLTRLSGFSENSRHRSLQFLSWYPVYSIWFPSMCWLPAWVIGRKRVTSCGSSSSRSGQSFVVASSTFSGGVIQRTEPLGSSGGHDENIRGGSRYTVLCMFLLWMAWSIYRNFTFIFTFVLHLFCLLVYLSVLFYTHFLTHNHFLQHKLLVPLFTFNLLCVVPGPAPDSAFSIFFFCVHFTPD